MWSEIYDRNLKEIFKLQNEIATAVSNALEVALNPSASARAEVPESPEAYNLLLKGNYYFHTRQCGRQR